jgi:hypothetical protein
MTSSLLQCRSWGRIMWLLCGLLVASSTLFSQGIEGTVIDSVTGLPIGGAKVSVEAGGKPVYQTTTDDQGVFRIQPVKAGTYTASFTKPEFLPSAQEGFAVGSNSIHLRGRLTPRSRVAGRVLDGSGRPVSGAELLLDGSLTGQTATSDEQGNFLFRATPGTYILSVRSPIALLPPAAAEDERLGWAHTYYPSVLDRYAAVKISVHAGSDVWGQDITLRVTRLFRVRGIVFDNRGDPAAKALVQAARTDETLSDDIRVVSEEDGSFEFPSLPEGEWQVFAETEGSESKLRVSAVFQVTSHDLDRLDLRLMAPFAVTGSVALLPAERARPDKKALGIFLQPLVAGSEGLSQTTADSSGNFRINNVYPGKYKIVAVSPGPPYFLNSVRMGNRELLGQYVELASGTLPLEIKFESEGGDVRGMVEDCGSATVVLAPQDSALQEPQFVRTARCGDLGRFQIANVRPGDYYAFAFDQWGGAAELLSGLDQSLVNKAVRVRVERGAFGNVALRITSRNQ